MTGTDETDTRVVGVDLGGTKTSAALVRPDGTTGPVRTAPTPAVRGPQSVLDQVGELVLAAAGDVPVATVGIGTAGLVDVEHGVIVSATDAMPGWPGTAVAAGVADRLSQHWGRKVRVQVENDVDAHAIGEAWLGAGRGVTSMLLVTVGTGVGAGVVLDGRPHRGAHHGAGEIGHVPIPGADGLRCACGRTGHLEAVAAGPAVARRYRAKAGADAGGPEVDGREVVRRAYEGDPLARRLVFEAGTALGRALAGQVTVLDPDVVVLGGGFAGGAGPLWWQAVEDALRADLIDVLQAVALVPPRLGDLAALLGAARSASIAAQPVTDPTD